MTTQELLIKAKNAKAEISVVKNNYPYKEAFRVVDLSSEAIYSTYKLIERFVFSGGGASSPLDLASRVAVGTEVDFLIRFYILFELGAISVGQGFALALRPIPDLSESVLYKRISALKKIL